MDIKNIKSSYKVSVIIPIYNSEKYLKECLDSLVNQTIDSLEVLIIDDGSTDNSSLIAKEYCYKNTNFRYYRQDNQGVSVARNLGISKSNGEYIAFLDSDDYVYEYTYEELYKLAKNEDADTVVGDIRCFNEHRSWKLSYMKAIFNKKLPTVRHIRKNHELHLTPSASNKLYKRELIVENNICFDSEISIGEDLLFTQKSLLLSNKTCIYNDVVLNYRVNDKEETLSKKSSIKFFEQLLILQNKLNKLYGDLGFENEISSIEARQIKFFVDSIFIKGKFLNEEDIMELLNIGNKFIETINNDDIINSLKIRDKLAIQMLKNNDYKNLTKLIEIVQNEKISKEIVIISKKYFSYLYNYFNEYKEVLRIEKLELVHKIEVIKLRKSILAIGGYAYIEGISTKNIKKELVFKSSKKEKVVQLENTLRTDISYLSSNNTINYDSSGFKTIEVDLLDILENEDWNVYLRVYSGDIVLETKIEVLLAQLRNNTKANIIGKKEINPIYKDSKLTVKIRNTNKIDTFKSRYTRFRKDLRYDLSFLKAKDFHTVGAILVYKVFSGFYRRKNIWVIGERRDTAQDNSYHLYKYIRENNPSVNIHYVIDKKSKDYDNIRNLGNIIEFGSFKHTLYLLLASKTINSYAETANMYTDSYKKIIKYYPEWQKNKKIFIQHGVIGVSRVNHVLNKNRMDYSMFVVSSQFEKDHIVKEFGYSEDEVVITGLARWDALEDTNTGKEILLMPTWRSWIKTKEQLEESDYFKTYISFLQNKRLHKILEEKDMTLTFFPHYQTQKLLGDLPFIHDKINIIKQGEETVQNLLKRHSILITDYSTVSFDFAYMDKPVVFYQFDYDDFYSKHYNEGPIDHKNDLFGERVESENQLISLLEDINSIYSSVKLKNVNKYIVKSNLLHCFDIFERIKGR